MIEEINEDNINKLLESLPEDLNAVERMIMVNEGTVQTLLSVLCRTPVKVEVISQYKLADVIIRWSKLIAEYPGESLVTVCLAESIIPISNPEGFINMINDREKGIGQIIKTIGLETSRHIKGFHVDASTFARTYTIEGDCSMVITEVFNRATIETITNNIRQTRSILVGSPELKAWYREYFGLQSGGAPSPESSEHKDSKGEK